MIKHKLIINGTQTIDSSSLAGFTLTETVNEGQDLTLGSVCSSMIDFSVRIADGIALPRYGDKITLFESDGREFVQHGIFYVETTKQITDRVYKVTAYDAVSRLDKDVAEWLQTVTFPISLYDLVNGAIQKCGLELVNASIPNGDYLVKKFQASGIKARAICKWAGEISAKFCHATDDGRISFDWYTPAETDIAYKEKVCDITHSYENSELKISGDCITADYVSGNVRMDSGQFTQSYVNGELKANYSTGESRIVYYMNSFNREAFQITPIEKVQIQSNPDDIGTIFPNVTGEKNTYKITGNYLLTADSGTALKPIAEYIYNQLKNVVYTPANVVYPSDFRVKVGNTVKIITSSGKEYTSYVMKRAESGSKDSIFCSGNKVRSASTAVNNQEYKALSGKYMNLTTDVEGIHAEVGDLSQGVTRLSVSVSGLSSSVSSLSGDVSTLSQSVSEISGEVTGKADKSAGGYNFKYTLNSYGFTVSSKGSTILNANSSGLTVTGEINADSGSIGGMDIANSALSTGGNTFDSSPANTVYFGPKGISLGTNFYVYSSGKMVAKSGKFTGEITADSGSIGGWQLSDWGIYNGKTGMQSSGKWAFAAGVPGDITGSWDSAPFRVSHAGKLYATGAYITGAVYASSGTFTGKITSGEGEVGGWTIDKKALRSASKSVNLSTTGISAIGSSGLLESATWAQVVKAARLYGN